MVDRRRTGCAAGNVSGIGRDDIAEDDVSGRIVAAVAVTDSIVDDIAGVDRSRRIVGLDQVENRPTHFYLGGIGYRAEGDIIFVNDVRGGRVHRHPAGEVLGAGYAAKGYFDQERTTRCQV